MLHAVNILEANKNKEKEYNYISITNNQNATVFGKILPPWLKKLNSIEPAHSTATVMQNTKWWCITQRFFISNNKNVLMWGGGGGKNLTRAGFSIGVSRCWLSICKPWHSKKILTGMTSPLPIKTLDKEQSVTTVLINSDKRIKAESGLQLFK